MINKLQSAEVYDIFPIPLYKVVLSDVKECNDFLDTVQCNIEFGDSFGDKSKDTYVLENPECAQLKNLICTHMKIYAQELMAWKVDHMTLLQSWISMKKQGQMHDVHYHSNSALSCVYFFSDYTDDVPPLIFVRNPLICQLMNQFSPDIDEERSIKTHYPWSQYIVKPENSMLIIFPSWCHHYVPPNPNSKPRKSLSANAIPEGIIGSRKLTTEINFNRN